MQDLELIRQFSANTVILLENDIAPLMQWLDVRGHSEAYQWDLLISQIQQQKLKSSGKLNDLASDAIAQLLDLPMNLNQVKVKADWIKQCRELGWWQTASLDELEQARTELRDIMQYLTKGTGPKPKPPVIDISDGDEVREKQSTYLNSVDMKAYIINVEQALQSLFDKNSILQKIRTGEAVTEQELDNLNALLHTQNPDVDLDVLKAFYDTATPLEQVLRSIVGMESEAVNKQFADFIQAYPKLTARQVQFLGLLKRQIAASGAIELSSLYEMPLAALGDIDTLFDNDQQVNHLLNIVKSFGNYPERKAIS